MARYDPSGRLIPFFGDWFGDTGGRTGFDDVFGDAFGNTDYDDYDVDWDNNDFDDTFRGFRRPFCPRPPYYDPASYGGGYSPGPIRMRRRWRGWGPTPTRRWPGGWDTQRGRELDWGGRPGGEDWGGKGRGGQDEDVGRSQRQLAVQQRPEEGRGGVSRIRNTRDKYQISIDVHHFKPEEITIRTTDNWINIEANHEERGDEHGYIKRHFRRRYLLPDNVKPERVASKLSPDGILTIIAPKESYSAVEGQERQVPVQYEGPKGTIEGGKPGGSSEGRQGDVDIPVGAGQQGKQAGEVAGGEIRGGDTTAVA